MSESDSFIQEVTEEVRQDRMLALWKRWGPFVLAALVLAVGGAALWSWLDAREQARAEARGAALLAAAPDALDQQQRLAESMDEPARLIAEFGVAAQLARQGETDVAAQAYRALAERAGIAPHYRQLALLQALRLEAQAGDPAAVLSQLEPLAQPGAPYAPLARELAAVVHLRAGDAAAARAEIEAILADPAATQALRLRARELLSIAAVPPGSAG